MIDTIAMENEHDDHETTLEERIQCALIEQMEAIKAYQSKYEEESRVQAKATNGR